MGKKKKVVRLTKVEAVARLDKMIPVLYRNIVNAIYIEATMETGNCIVQKMPDKAFPGAEAFNVIMQSLAVDLAMHLARLYDLGTRNRHINSRDVHQSPSRCTSCVRYGARRSSKFVPGTGFPMIIA